MITTKKLRVIPAIIALKTDRHKPIHVTAPLWKKRVIKSQVWFLKHKEFFER